MRTIRLRYLRRHIFPPSFPITAAAIVPKTVAAMSDDTEKYLMTSCNMPQKHQLW